MITIDQETVGHDTEYMQKYNKDVNTTLIFVRLCIPSLAAQR